VMSGTTHGQHWSNCDDDIHGYLLRLAARCKTLLAEKFLAVYLHGSLAMGSFRRATSDLDVLCVSTDQLDPELTAAVTDGFVLLSNQRPIAGDIEVSVVHETYLKPFVHPTPYEVHYSAAVRAEIVSGRMVCSGPSVDRDLAAHCEVLRARGVVLEGPPIHSVIGQVPRAAFIDALLYDLADILNGTVLTDAPVYGILNCCRILAALGSHGPGVINKEEGGLWGLAHMNREHRILVGQALEVQRGRWPISPQHRNTGGLRWNQAAVESFRGYVAEEAGRLLGAHLVG
jgi:predicted nucleotidyltransferase